MSLVVRILAFVVVVALQHMSMEAQLARKQEALLEHLQNYGNVRASEIYPVLQGPYNGITGARRAYRYVMWPQRNECWSASGSVTVDLWQT